ncbi:MAG: hypothetical protein RIS70_2427, partial [Planctomycetota bacterium]
MYCIHRLRMCRGWVFALGLAWGLAIGFQT